MGRDIAKDIGDPLVQAWQVAWDGHALAHQPLSLFQANTFWPLPDSLAFSDALVGYAPGRADRPRRRTPRSPATTCCSCSPTRCASSARGCWRASSGPAAAAPRWRARRSPTARGASSRTGTCTCISSGGIPLALFLLVRGYRRGRRALIVSRAGSSRRGSCRSASRSGCCCCTCWPAGRSRSRSIWWRRGRPRPPRNVAVATARRRARAVRWSRWLLARPYLRVLHDHPEAHRTAAQVEAFSGPVKAFVATSKLDRVWGAALAPGARHAAASSPSRRCSPASRCWRWRSLGPAGRRCARRLRIGLGVGGARARGAVAGLPRVSGDAVAVSRIAGCSRCCPGWQGIRVPGRLMTLTSLALALLAAGGADVADRVGARAPRARALAARSPRCSRRGRARRGLGLRPPPARAGRAARAARRCRRRCSCCPPRAPTTAAPCCGRPTASPISSTAAAASSRASSTPCSR